MIWTACLPATEQQKWRGGGGPSGLGFDPAPPFYRLSLPIRHQTRACIPFAQNGTAKSKEKNVNFPDVLHDTTKVSTVALRASLSFSLSRRVHPPVKS